MRVNSAVNPSCSIRHGRPAMPTASITPPTSRAVRHKSPRGGFRCLCVNVTHARAARCETGTHLTRRSTGRASAGVSVACGSSVACMLGQRLVVPINSALCRPISRGACGYPFPVAPPRVDGVSQAIAVGPNHLHARHQERGHLDAPCHVGCVAVVHAQFKRVGRGGAPACPAALKVFAVCHVRPPGCRRCRSVSAPCQPLFRSCARDLPSGAPAWLH